MLRNPKNFRIAMLVFGFAVAFPVAMTLASDIASASGYMVASGIVPVCEEGGNDDCPDNGTGNG